MTDIRRSILKGMADIVGDLYPEEAGKNTAIYKSASTPVPAKQPALPAFCKLWKTADETIDWTDILVSPTPTDGLTAPEKWAVYHRHAEGVLKGDIAAYLAVLQYENPMADLTPYVSALDVATVDSNTLKATFGVRSDLMKDDAHQYLCGMAVRIARDLFAALPVLTVEVIAAQDDKSVLTVDFTRAQMNKVRFAFIDPVEFAVKCGAIFTEEESTCSAN